MVQPGKNGIKERCKALIPLHGRWQRPQGRSQSHGIFRAGGERVQWAEKHPDGKENISAAWEAAEGLSLHA